MSPRRNDGRGVPAPPTTHVGRFNFDLATALGEQLKAHFERDLRPEPLTAERIASLDQTQGVYALHRNGVLVYIGQAIDLRKRLGEHREKITGRQDIDVAEIEFSCTYIDAAWVPLTHEKSLLEVFKSRAVPCEWNGKGFGIHDPGRNRETTKKSPLGFDSRFPIKRDWPCRWILPGPHNARDLLMDLKGGLPFLLRYQVDNRNRWRDGSHLYNDLTINVPRADMPADELLADIRRQFPRGWQATAFPGHMIMYRERKNYAPHGDVL